MERLSAPTGGRALFTDSIDELHGAFADLLDELSNQYLLGYQSTNSQARRRVAARSRSTSTATTTCARGRATALWRANDARTINRGDRRDAQRADLSVLRALRSLRVSAVASVVVGAAQQQPPKPRFQSSVEVTSLDVTVVDDRGKPIADLDAGRLQRPDRRQRAARGHRRVGAAGRRRPARRRRRRRPTATAPTRASTGGRLIVIAVDQPNIRFGGAMAIAQGGQRVHRSAVAVGSRRGGRLRHRRAGDAVHRGSRAGQAGDRAHGRPEAGRPRRCDLGTTSRWPRRWRSIAAIGRRSRRCRAASARASACRRRRWTRAGTQVEMEARAMAQDAQPRRPTRRSQTLRDAVRRPAADRRAEDADPHLRRLRAERQRRLIIELGAMAAAARTSIYALKLDNAAVRHRRRARADQSVRAIARRGPRGSRRWPARRAARCSPSPAPGRRCSSASSRSSPATTCSASSPIRRDQDGKPHPIRVDVPRARRDRPVAPADAERGRPIGAAPRVAARRRSRRRSARRCSSSALPLRVASFALQGPERDKVQLLIHADIGTDYPASKVGVGRLRHHRQRRPDGRQQGGRRAAAAGHDRRAVAAAVHRRREPAARRLHVEARRRRRRARRHASSTRFTRRCRTRAA